MKNVRLQNKRYVVFLPYLGDDVAHNALADLAKQAHGLKLKNAHLTVQDCDSRMAKLYGVLIRR